MAEAAEEIEKAEEHKENDRLNDGAVGASPPPHH